MSDESTLKLDCEARKYWSVIQAKTPENYEIPDPYIVPLLKQFHEKGNK
jgi:hypothetical protein